MAQGLPHRRHPPQLRRPRRRRRHHPARAARAAPESRAAPVKLAEDFSQRGSDRNDRSNAFPAAVAASPRETSPSVRNAPQKAGLILAYMPMLSPARLAAFLSLALVLTSTV